MKNYQPQSTNFTPLVWLVVVIVVYFLLKNQIASIFKGIEQGNVSTDPNSQAASELRSAFTVWYGVNSSGVLAAAEKINDFKRCSDAYNNLFNRDLSEDLADELNQADQAQFWAIVNGNTSTKTGGGVSTTTTGGGTASYSQLEKNTGHTCYAKIKLNVWDTQNSTLIKKTVSQGADIGRIVSVKEFTSSKGLMSYYYLVMWTKPTSGAGYVKCSDVAIR